MNRAILHIRFEDETSGRDLEVPLGITAVQLTELLCQALGRKKEGWRLAVDGNEVEEAGVVGETAVCEGASLVLFRSLG